MKRTVLAVLAMSAALVLAAPAAAQYVGNITVGLSAVAGQCPGDTITVTGTEFTPGGDVTVLFDGDVIATTQADAAGNVAVEIALPEASAGEHVVTLVDETSGKSVSTTLVCVGAAAAPGLAVTGGDFKVWMLLVGGLIVIGAVALVAGRRRARNA
ncbi:MAG TPA: hypothetical protein VHL78_14255 [Actinomycetota bacterium]|nr:hypothetical protein [Actinomycetota bacterium]